MTNFINFDVEKFDILEESTNSQFATGRIQAFTSSSNLHNMYCSEEVLKQTAPTIYDKPIVYNFPKSFWGQDFGSHTSPDRSLICGFIVPDSAEFTNLDDSRLALNVSCKLWKRYSEKVIDVLKQSNGKKSVSVEMELYDSASKDDGLKEMLSFAYTAVCLLGDGVIEASPGANIEILSFAEKNQEIKEAYQLEFGKYDSIDFKIPKKVRENVLEALELYKKHGRGATSNLLALAHHLANNEIATPDKIRLLARRNPKLVTKKDKSASEYIANGLCGGDPGFEWSQAISKKLDELDSKHVSYFSNMVTFPYKNREDMNPALQGIDPPITASQGSEIAKIADAIGEDKGWPIAISQWKKNHVVKNGAWVESREKKMSDNIEFANKDDWGTGETISIDKSKDVLSSKSWGSVDKTSLMHQVLKAKNYKTLVNDVYLIVDSDWEDHPSSSLHYPVMQISGGKAVYNRYGLSSALQRAEGQNETGLISKIKGLYTKLGLNFEMKEVNNSVTDKEKEKEEKEDPEEEKKETPEQEKEENKKENDSSDNQDDKDKDEKYSLDANLDLKAFLAMLQNETDEYESIAAEFAKPESERNYAKVFGVTYGVMYAKNAKLQEMCDKFSAEKEETCGRMTKMEADNKAYMTENEQLKKEKAEREQKEYAFSVDALFKSLEDKFNVPQSEWDSLKEASKNYDLRSFDAFSNLAKAKMVDFATKGSINDGLKRYALPHANQEKKIGNLLW